MTGLPDESPVALWLSVISTPRAPKGALKSAVVSFSLILSALPSPRARKRSLILESPGRSRVAYRDSYRISIGNARLYSKARYYYRDVRAYRSARAAEKAPILE